MLMGKPGAFRAERRDPRGSHMILGTEGGHTCLAKHRETDTIFQWLCPTPGTKMMSSIG